MTPLPAALSARLDSAANNAVRATLVAAVLSVVDLAGNSIKTRTTALFAPDGYEPAAIKVRWAGHSDVLVGHVSVSVFILKT